MIHSNYKHVIIIFTIKFFPCKYIKYKENIYICFLFSEWINTQFIVTKKDFINFINKMASNKRKYRKAVTSKEKIKTKGQKNIKSKRKNKDQNILLNNNSINIDSNLITIIFLLIINTFW